MDTLVSRGGVWGEVRQHTGDPGNRYDSQCQGGGDRPTRPWLGDGQPRPKLQGHHLLEWQWSRWPDRARQAMRVWKQDFLPQLKNSSGSGEVEHRSNPVDPVVKPFPKDGETQSLQGDETVIMLSLQDYRQPIKSHAWTNKTFLQDSSVTENQCHESSITPKLVKGGDASGSTALI